MAVSSLSWLGPVTSEELEEEVSHDHVCILWNQVSLLSSEFSVVYWEGKVGSASGVEENYNSLTKSLIFCNFVPPIFSLQPLQVNGKLSSLALQSDLRTIPDTTNTLTKKWFLNPLHLSPWNAAVTPTRWPRYGFLTLDIQLSLQQVDLKIVSKPLAYSCSQARL